MTKINTTANPHDYRTFTIHETCAVQAKSIAKSLFIYKHLENILNLLLKDLYHTQDPAKQPQAKTMFWFLLDGILMKEVLSGRQGGHSSAVKVQAINQYFQDNSLFQDAKALYGHINDKNIAMVIRRLNKDWSHYINAKKEYDKGNPKKLLGSPSYPKAKKLSKVYSYSVPLDSGKFSDKKLKNGLLGVNVGKRMLYAYIGKEIGYIQSKKINHVTVSYSHGHIYYQLTYLKEKAPIKKRLSSPIKQDEEKEAGIDVGVINLLSVFINDHHSQSLIMSGKQLISMNVHFNKKLAKLNERISTEIATSSPVTRQDGQICSVPTTYTVEGRKLIHRRSALFERRRREMDDYLNRISKKVLQYLHIHGVTVLVLSKNLSFTKTTGAMNMWKKTKQKFYQIPFGQLLNMIERKAMDFGIRIEWIDEAFTSKTSSIHADVNDVQNKCRILREKKHNKIPIMDSERLTSNDLKGSRGGKTIGRGMYLDRVLNKLLNADLNGACNHIKVYLKDHSQKMITDITSQKGHLMKWCNPVKIKSKHDFDVFMNQIMLTEKSRSRARL